ncbi:MAG: CinA family protein [Dactylosporangium sp.]|nr:CinA family protein [Dactylosporangium sp.]NNJ61787.1 CinA family protein [Dactylosporangium sp.]
MRTAATEVLAGLEARGQTLATAESLTGGLLSAALVAVPGASRVFRGALVVYATDLKTTLAGVPAELLARRGPVDGEVAAAMAAGARRGCGADWGVSTTGVAGPGPHDGHPAGTVWIAVVGPGHRTTRRLAARGDRQAIRTGAVRAALGLLAEALGRNAEPPSMVSST